MPLCPNSSRWAWPQLRQMRRAQFPQEEEDIPPEELVLLRPNSRMRRGLAASAPDQMRQLRRRTLPREEEEEGGEEESSLEEDVPLRPAGLAASAPGGPGRKCARSDAPDAARTIPGEDEEGGEGKRGGEFIRGKMRRYAQNSLKPAGLAAVRQTSAFPREEQEEDGEEN